MDYLVEAINECIVREYEKMKDTPDVEDRIDDCFKQIKWENPHLAMHVKRAMTELHKRQIQMMSKETSKTTVEESELIVEEIKKRTEELKKEADILLKEAEDVKCKSCQAKNLSSMILASSIIALNTQILRAL